MKFSAITIPIIILLIAIYTGAYVVDETEQVVVTQFGKAVGKPKTEPGLYFKIPFIQHANYFPKNLLQWDGDPAQVPTLEKTFIWVDTFARWKIIDPLKFFQSVNRLERAFARLDEIIDPAVRDFIASYPLIETVRMSNRNLVFESGLDRAQETRTVVKITVGRQKIINGVLEQAQPKLEELGIQLVDVKIKRLNYVEDVRKSVYARMIAERKQIAEKFRSEGQGEARRIEGNRERELKRITSEAYKTAEETKGKADGEATRIYAESYGKDPDFYSFLKTLDIYKNTMDKESSLILSTDSDFLKYFKGYKSKE